MAPNTAVKIGLATICICITCFTLTAALECEQLEPEICAYTVSSYGRRCLLEMDLMPEGNVQLSCVTSELVAKNLFDWIETDDCIKDCGLHRMSIGLSPQVSIDKLCSSACLDDCPNIVDYYSSIAAEEGINMADVCETQSPEVLSDLSWESPTYVEENDSWILASKAVGDTEWHTTDNNVNYAPAAPPSAWV